jgi:DNA-binding transcriptional MerR regulator
VRPPRHPPAPAWDDPVRGAGHEGDGDGAIRRLREGAEEAGPIGHGRRRDDGEAAVFLAVLLRAVEHGLITARRESNGSRDYDEWTVERAEIIHLLFGMDFPREVVASVLACAGEAPAETHDALAEQLVHVRAGLAERIKRLTETHRQVSEFLEERGL